MTELPKPEFYPEHRRFIDPASGELFVLGDPIVKGGIVERERIHVIDDQKNRVLITAIEDIVVDPVTGECSDRAGKAIIDPSIPSDFPSKKVYCQLDGTYTGRNNSKFKLAMLKQFALFASMPKDIQKEVLKHVPLDTLLQVRLASKRFDTMVKSFTSSFLELVDFKGEQIKTIGFDAIIIQYNNGDIFSPKELERFKEYDRDWLIEEDDYHFLRSHFKSIAEGSRLDAVYESSLLLYLKTKIRRECIGANGKTVKFDPKNLKLSLREMAGKIASWEWIVLSFPEFEQ